MGGQLRLDHESARIKANIASILEYREYLDDTFDSDVVGNFIAEGKFDIVEERFAWLLSDTFGQTSTRSARRPTPGQPRVREFHFRPAPISSCHSARAIPWYLRGLYSDFSYEDSDLGNDACTVNSRCSANSPRPASVR